MRQSPYKDELKTAARIQKIGRPLFEHPWRRGILGFERVIKKSLLMGVLKWAVFIDGLQYADSTVTSLALLSAATQRSMGETQTGKHAGAKRYSSNFPADSDKP